MRVFWAAKKSKFHFIKLSQYSLPEFLNDFIKKIIKPAIKSEFTSLSNA